MQTNQDLERLALRLHLPLRFIGSKDELPQRPYPGGYIVNMEDDRSSDGTKNNGTHWVGLYITPHLGFYMDSFGVSPPADIQLFVRKHNIPLIMNGAEIQNPRSGYCGNYVLSFLYDIHRSPTQHQFQQWIEKFATYPEKNLRRLQKIIGQDKKREHAV